MDDTVSPESRKKKQEGSEKKRKVFWSHFKKFQ